MMEKKSTLYRYDLCSNSGAWLATVVLGDDGFFTTISEWGSYTYWWKSFGQDFREFLLDCDESYLISKLNPERIYDGERTFLRVKRLIARCVRNEEIERSKALEDFERMKYYNQLRTEIDLAMWYDGCRSPIDPTEMAIYSVDWKIKKFVEIVWLKLKEAISKELSI